MSKEQFEKQVSRKENLDRFLLNMHLEQDKLKTELDKIGEHPKTVPMIRRRNEINDELQILLTNIGNIKQKLKSLNQAGIH